jgi:hypothetical protein
VTDVFEDLRCRDDGALKVSQRLFERKCHGPASRAMDDGGGRVCVLFKATKRYIGLAPVAQSPKLPLFARPCSMADAADNMPLTREEASHMATQKSVCPGYQNRPLCSYETIDLQSESLESLSPNCLQQLSMVEHSLVTTEPKIPNAPASVSTLSSGYVIPCLGLGPAFLIRLVRVSRFAIRLRLGVADYSHGITRHNSVCRNILSDERARSYYRAPSYSHSLENSAIESDPSIILDHDS